MLQEIRQTREFNCAHGAFVTSDDALGQNDGVSVEIDPFKLLIIYTKENRLRLWDLFAQFDKDGSGEVSADEFKMGIKVNFSEQMT